MDNEFITMLLSAMLFPQESNSQGVLSSNQMRSILGQNMDKNMVQRLFNPNIFPVINRPDLGEDVVATHLMGSNGKTVFPFITQNPSTGKLEMAEVRSPSIPYDWREAQRIATGRGDAIDFNTEEEAQYFGENYKSALR